MHVVNGLLQRILIEARAIVHCSSSSFESIDVGSEFESTLQHCQVTAMVNKSKLNDDYLGALLRVQGVPNEVVVSLLKTNNCNIIGLRSVLGVSQGKCAKKIGINVDLLDGLPHKVRFSALMLLCTAYDNG